MTSLRPRKGEYKRKTKTWTKSNKPSKARKRRLTPKELANKYVLSSLEQQLANKVIIMRKAGTPEKTIMDWLRKARRRIK
tara:strand:+ start:100 stop:339 length:240 start_codon:yes stop_codon:yes gene_type:complete